MGGGALALPWEFRVDASPTHQQYLKNPLFPDSFLTPAPSENSMTPPARDSITTYSVLPGDNVSDIAIRFGISPETIVQANKLVNEHYLKVGQELIILPVSGAFHKVQSGDTVQTIARAYGVDAKAIADYPGNGLSDPGALSLSQALIVPGGKAPQPGPVVVASAPVAVAAAAPVATPRPVATAATVGTGRFNWPTYGPITQYFHRWHGGIDIAPSWGTPVYASNSGTVINVQRWNWGYGWYVIVDHGNGFTTLYGHLSAIYVSVGQYVNRGQHIANTGSTGLSSGPHLHFEIRYGGVSQNPLNYLP